MTEPDDRHHYGGEPGSFSLIDRLGERVRCTGCSGDFGPEVLELTPEQVAAANAPWRCADCDNANPRSEPCCLGCGRPA